MADNVTLPGTGEIVAADDVGSSVKVQQVKLDVGGNGATQLMDSSHPVYVSAVVTGNPAVNIGTPTVTLSNPGLTDAELRTTPVPVSGNVTATVTGVATAAKQPALGTAGTSSADVLTVQGRASMTPLLVDASATTQPVSFTTLPAGTNNIGDVDVLSLPALPAGSNNIGDVDVLTLPALPAGSNTIGSVSLASIGAISTANSRNTVLAGAAVFTGTSEDVSQYSEIRVSVIASHASAANGLSIQQSSDNTNWDLVDTYTIAAATAFQFSVPVGAQYFRIVYTNGATLQTYFRLQVMFNKLAGNPSSQRPSDARSAETDMMEVSAVLYGYNGTGYDRIRSSGTGVLTIGGAVTMTSTTITSLVPGVAATSLGKAEDAVHASGDTGVAVLAVRTDVPATTSNATGDYDVLHTGAEGGVQVNPIASAATGATTQTITSAASTNATSVKAAKGVVWGYEFFNSSASAKYVKFFNKASSPTVGTDTPVNQVLVPAGGGAIAHMRMQEFATGIAIAITGAVAPLDTTVVAANDVVGVIIYK